MKIIKDVATTFETIVLDADGKPATGITVTYIVYNSSWEDVAHGTLTESISGVFYVSLTLSTLGQYCMLISTPVGYENGMEQITVIDEPAKESTLEAENEKLSRILGMVQENFRAFDHVYDEEGNQISSTVKIYGSATDCTNDVSPIATYQVTATYLPGRKLASYKVIKV